MNRYRERDAVAISTLPAHHELRSISFRVSIAIGFFFGLSVLFYVLVAIADSQIPGGVGVFVWGRSITELVLACAYFLFAYLFRRGKFWGYMCLFMTSALALVSTLSVVLLSGDYPW